MQEEKRNQTYAAFISYTHAEPDMRIAAWLQRQLEHFRIPRKIQKETGQPRIGRVFRDVEELSLTTDLTMEIKEALSRTEYLIVVCSAKAYASQWVAREIEFFISLHGSEKILTVLAEGEPENVIPAGLRADGKEPLSCDCRMPLRTAKREELPRLAAAMLGCSYDGLRQRQRQYRARRNGVIAACVSAVFVCVSGYLTWNNMRIRGLLRESQIASSKILARNSMETLEAGDRIRAIELALEALCGTEEGDKRPEISEAVHALEESLSAYIPEGRFHLEATRTYTEQQRIRSCLVSPDGKYLVICTSQKLTVYETESGTIIAAYPFQAGRTREAACPVCDGKGGFYVGDGQELVNIRFSDGAEQWRVPLLESADSASGETEIRSIVLVPGIDGGDRVAAATYDSVVLIDPEKGNTTGRLHAEQVSTEAVHYRFLPSYRAGKTTQNGSKALHPEILPAADGKKLWICTGVAGVDYHFNQIVCWDLADGSCRVLEPEDPFRTGQDIALLPDGDLILTGFAQKEDFSVNTAVRKALTAPLEEQRNSGKLTVARVDQKTGETRWRKQIPYSGRTDSGVHMILSRAADNSEQDAPCLAVSVSEELRIFDSGNGKELYAGHEPAEILSLYEEEYSATEEAGREPNARIRCFLRTGAVASETTLLSGFVDTAEDAAWISAEKSAAGHAMWFLVNPDSIIQYQLGSGNPETEVLSGLSGQEEAAEDAAVLTSDTGMLLETSSAGSGTGAFSWFPAGETTCAWQWRKPGMASVVPVGFTQDAQTIVLTERSMRDGLVRWRLILLNVEDGTAQYVKLPQSAPEEKVSGDQDNDRAAENSAVMPGGALLPDESAEQVLAVSALCENRVAYILSGRKGTHLGVYDVTDGSVEFRQIAEGPVSSPVLVWGDDASEIMAGFSDLNRSGAAEWKRIRTDQDDVEELPLTIPTDGFVCTSSDGAETAVCQRGGNTVQIASADGTNIRQIENLPFSVMDLFLRKDNLYILEESGRLHRYDRSSLQETAQIETIPFTEKAAGADLVKKTEPAEKRVQWEVDSNSHMLWIHYAEELAVVDLEADCLRTTVHDCISCAPDHSVFYVITGDEQRIPGRLPYYTTAELIQMGKTHLSASPDEQSAGLSSDDD